MVRVHLTRCVAFFFLRFCPPAGVRVCLRAPVTRAVKNGGPVLTAQSFIRAKFGMEYDN